MTTIQADFAWWDAHLGKPYWRPGSPGTRFGQWGYDCSGACTCALRAGGVTGLPTSSGDFARWGMATGRAHAIRNARQARPGDLVIYDQFGVPQDSNGPRGHIGQVAADGIHTHESNGSHGVSIMDRGTGFWCLAVDMSDYFPTTPTPPPAPTPEEIEAMTEYTYRDPGTEAIFLVEGAARMHVNTDQLALYHLAAGLEKPKRTIVDLGNLTPKQLAAAARIPLVGPA